MKQVRELIKKLESKVYKGETISLLELKKHLEQQNEVFWLDFERILTVSRKNHTKKERIPLTLRELRKWRKEWKNKSVADSTEKKVGETSNAKQKVGQNDEKPKSNLNQPLINKVKKLIKELESKVFKGKLIFKGELKRTLYLGREEFQKEFEEQLKINRKKNSRYVIPLTLEEFQEWKKEFQRLKVSPTSKPNFEKKEENKKNSFYSSPENLKSEQKKEISPTSIKFGKVWGPFIYELRSNRLWYLDKEMKWDRKSLIGGDWFSYAGAGISINLWLMFQTEWQIVVHVKFSQNGTIYSHKAHFSALKTEKVPFVFGSWSEVYKNSEGKWERKEDLQAAQKFLEKHGIELKIPDEKESKLNEIKKIVSQLSEKEKELVREKLIQLEKKHHGNK